VKPHIVRQGQAGEVLQSILESNFRVAALMSVHLTSFIAEEFFQSYRGVIQEYSQALQSICSGPCLAIAVVQNETTTRFADTCGDLVSDFRDFVGPCNPQLAKVLRPKSLRALYGVNLVDNAVHCTDLSEDGEMECRFFFQTLANL
jgi:nucleoside-diphosphate kinase